MTSQSSIQVQAAPAPVDPITALIAAHAPTNPAEILRPLPVPSEVAVADWSRRRAQVRHDVEGTPRGLIPVSGIRCGEYL